MLYKENDFGNNFSIYALTLFFFPICALKYQAAYFGKKSDISAVEFVV